MWSVNELCSGLFTRLGIVVGRHPLVFILVPVIVAFGLSLGAINGTYRNDIEYLYTLRNGEAWREHDVIRTHFPQNTTARFTPSRLNSPGRFARIIVQRKDGESILNTETWDQLLELDEIVQNISVEWKGESQNYSELCAGWNGDCYKNDHLGLSVIMDRIENGSLRLSHLMFNPVNFETYPLSLFCSGFKLNGTAITFIRYITLDYFARTDSDHDKLIGLAWERAFVDRMSELSGEWKDLEMAYTTYSSIENELERNMFSVFPYLSVSVTLMFIFVMVTSWSGDWVTSKSFVAALGIGSAFLGAIASVGVLCLANVPFININAAIPFIALGVGVDDTFVMLSAWWRTSRMDSVEKRMGHTYAEAAVSITITTLTDALSFYVGTLSQTPSVQIFCAYAGTAVLFIYIWHIFFFGGVMALCGKFEEQNRHSVFLWKIVKPNNEPVENGDSSPKIEDEKKGENALMGFFRDSYFPFLQKRSTQALVLLVYAIYIGVSAWGVSQMQDGLKLGNLATGDSYMVKYFDLFDLNFREYPYRSQVAITTPLDYSNKTVQDSVLKYLDRVAKLPSMTSEYMENWLSDFLRFVDNYGEFYELNITTEQNFIDTLREFYLRDSIHISEDIKFNENFTQIVSTRYILQHFQSPDNKAEKELLETWRVLASEVKEEMEVTTFHPFDMLLDVSVVLRSMTLTLVALAAGIVMIVAVLFIPSVSSVLLVFLSIASVELGVLGFMVFCNINLDIISVITLIMCIGFSVDFPAHVSYAYISSDGETVEDRVRVTVHSLGLPILQGALSTIVALSGLLPVNSYIARAFVKVVSLVMVFSVFIALLVLPVVLLLVRPGTSPTKKCSPTTTTKKVNED